MATSFKPVKGRGYVFYVGLVDQANTKLLKASPTIAAGDFKISKDGGTFANLTNLPAFTPSTGGNTYAVKIDLTSTEMTADNVVVTCVDAAGAEWCDQMISIETREQKSDYFHFVMRDTSGNPATGKTVTVTRVIDNGSFGAGTVGSVTEIANGVYRVALPLADLNAQDCTTLYATATGCMPTLITLTSAY
jgi:hypothetical protein